MPACQLHLTAFPFATLRPFGVQAGRLRSRRGRHGAIVADPQRRRRAAEAGRRRTGGFPARGWGRLPGQGARPQLRDDGGGGDFLKVVLVAG